MKVSALVPWLTILTCMVLGTAGAGYYYCNFQLPATASTPEKQAVASKDDPTKDRRTDDKPTDGRGQKDKPSDGSRDGGRKDNGSKDKPPPPPPPTPGVVVLVLQTELLTKKSNQNELTAQLRDFKKQYGGQLHKGTVYLVNKKAADGAPWDCKSLENDAAFANDDVSKTFQACAQAMQRLGGERTLVVWGCDRNLDDITNKSTADVKPLRGVKLFWIGYDGNSPWLSTALKESGSTVVYLKDEIGNLFDTMADALDKKP